MHGCDEGLEHSVCLRSDIAAWVFLEPRAISLLQAVSAVYACAKRTIAVRLKHDRVDLIRRPKLFPKCLQLAAHGVIESIQHSWPVECDGSDAIIDVKLYGLEHLAHSPNKPFVIIAY